MFKRIIFVLVVAVVLSSGCKGDKATDVNEAFFNAQQLPTNQVYIIEGVVKCSYCRPYDLMMVQVVDEHENNIISPWSKTFDNGEFKLSDVMLTPEDTVLLRVTIGSVMAPREKDINVPEDNKDPIKVSLSFD